MYQRKSRLTSRQQSEFIKLFVAGSTARASVELFVVQANTAIWYFMGLHRLIPSRQPGYEFCGEVELGESYLGGRC